MPFVPALLIAAVVLAAFGWGHQRAKALELSLAAAGGRLHSRPSYHGLLLAAAAIMGAVLAAVLAAVIMPMSVAWAALVGAIAVPAAVSTRLVSDFRARNVFA